MTILTLAKTALNYYSELAVSYANSILTLQDPNLTPSQLDIPHVKKGAQAFFHPRNK